MKKFIAVCLLLFLAPFAFAAQLSKESIQGRWYIVKIGDFTIEETDLGEDVWEFTGDQWIVHSSGIAMRPEVFKIEGDSIIYRDVEIKVTNFTGDTMGTDAIGFIQEFRREE